MTLHPHPIGPIPEETVRAARASFPHGNLYMDMRDELGVLYTDATFATLFGTSGQPAFSPWRLALVTIMQYAEGLTDEQAATAVRDRLAWKYALGLELTHAGFDASLLSEFRTRLVTGQEERLLFETMLDHFRDRGLVKARGRQRTDSTHVLAAIRRLNRLELVGETMRHALNTLAMVAPTWLREQADPAWVERYAPRYQEYRLPRKDAEREALATIIGRDGARLLTALAAVTAPAGLQEVDAVQTLRRVWEQQYEGTGDQLHWRPTETLPPGAELIASPYDPDARYSEKRQISWVGYKEHVTETCDPDYPSLITDVETTLATTPDSQVTPHIQERLADHDRLPARHLVDGGYMDTGLLVSSQSEHAIELIGPVQADTSWQARAGQGFDQQAFGVDWEAQQVICPTGRVSQNWAPATDQRGTAIIRVQFALADCRACPSREQCTHAARRSVTLYPREQYEALAAARQRQQTEGFRQEYATRAGIEGTHSQADRLCDVRQARYLGLAKTRLQHLLTAAAINFVRVGAWLAETPRARTRQSAFPRLMAHAT